MCFEINAIAVLGNYPGRGYPIFVMKAFGKIGRIVKPHFHGNFRNVVGVLLQKAKRFVQAKIPDKINQSLGFIGEIS